MVQVALATKATILLASRSETAKLPMLMDTLADPVNPGVIPDCTVSWVNKDNLIILVG